MPILVYTEIHKGKVKKSSLECINYAYKIAQEKGTGVVALANRAGEEELKQIGNAGAKKILSMNAETHEEDPAVLASMVEQAVKQENADLVIFAFDFVGKAVAPVLSAKLKAGIVAGAIDHPVTSGNSLEVRKNVFSGKANAVYSIESEIKIISLLPNSFPVWSKDLEHQVVDFKPEPKAPRIKVKEIKSTSSAGKVPLPDAEVVVSAGRGMKGPENWKMVEELADELGATLACSRPVADMHWRPHHEHVGQTGISIRPNLYVAIGISGAIQHLAGVSGSKTIVVINNDKEAPFFKSADYGVVGDAFSIIPKLTEAVKKFKAGKN
jgi:electron transfer flavoprotein alpha subunit